MSFSGCVCVLSRAAVLLKRSGLAVPWRGVRGGAGHVSLGWEGALLLLAYD